MYQCILRYAPKEDSLVSIELKCVGKVNNDNDFVNLWGLDFYSFVSWISINVDELWLIWLMVILYCKWPWIPSLHNVIYSNTFDTMSTCRSRYITKFRYFYLDLWGLWSEVVVFLFSRWGWFHSLASWLRLTWDWTTGRWTLGMCHCCSIQNTTLIFTDHLHQFYSQPKQICQENIFMTCWKGNM